MCFVVASVSNSGVFILSIFLVVVMLRKLCCAGEWTGVPMSARQSLQSSQLPPDPCCFGIFGLFVGHTEDAQGSLALCSGAWGSYAMLKSEMGWL